MHFLEDCELRDWWAEHGLELEGGSRARAPTGARVVERMVYAEGRRSGRERGVAEACLERLGDWTEALLLPLEWGIWGSGEDWPAYYAARGDRGERRSLEKAPGHLFAGAERADLLHFLTLVMENGWDAVVLVVRGGALQPVHLLVSHDEFVEVRASRA